MKATDFIYPTPISAPLAHNGTRNVIPEEATGTNRASVSEGFPDMTMIAPADGGLPPWGQDVNGMLYMASDIKSFLQSGGFITFNQAECDAIGGYPQGAVVGYIDNNNIYYQVRSLIDDNTYDFVAHPEYIDGEKWEKLQTQSIQWGSIAGTLSNQEDLQEALSKRPKKNENETIDATWTFGASDLGNTEGGQIQLKMDPEHDSYQPMIIDVNSGMGRIYGGSADNLKIFSVNFSDGSVTLPETMPVSDNSNHAASTNYVNNKIQLVSSLPASPEANVLYCIPE
jgi:hypothetical protein